MKASRAKAKRELRDSGDRHELKLPQIAPETKKSATAILLFGLAALLILSALEKAGPAGIFIFTVLERLFGWGYYLIPAIAIVVAALFIATREKKFFSITFLGAIGFLIFGLGLIDLVFPARGGFVGNVVGLLEIPFGSFAAIILASTFIIVSLLITFNASIKLPKFTPAENNENESEEEIEPVIANSETMGNPKEAAKEISENPDVLETKEKLKPEPVTEVVIAEPASASFKVKKPVAIPKNYVAPPLALLKSSVEKPTSGDLRSNANIIKRTLESFGVSVEMGEISIGPKVTRYTLKPAEGIKLARITALNQDLALSLAAHPIRIEAPIPGKSLVGIEVPNKAAAIVRLGSLMAYPEFMNSGPLGFPLGRDVSGEPIFIDIEKMPHLLIAGSTGSGKSICIHSILISLLYKNSPETLKMILIDPKRVELSAYNGIPHLVAPVITQAKKTVGVFRWAIQEMEKRYETLLKSGSRDIKSYNKKIAEKKSEEERPLPYLVIVIDELADLMATYGREIEGSIVRLAQMARATGIHLLVSTQRPSVEVITGLIKANITARVALQVASQIDSRTILDMAGAEKLLGGGDLLFISSEFSKPKRIQGAYISEEEIRKITDFIEKNNIDSIEIPEAIDQAIETASQENKRGIFDEYSENDDGDELLEKAITVVREAQKASASLLQRRLKVGYARAARLLDIMEAKGIVGPGEGAKPREILME
ncbi:MAG TPA: DNA translocase FtsK [Candidatus Paceibacterota bacterium]